MRLFFGRQAKNGKITMQSRLWKMIVVLALPLMIVIFAIASVAVGYALQYNAILNNVTTAADFNQDFKYNVDLKMYYYVSDSQYSDGLPIEDIQTAETLARKLIETTTEKDSLRSINDVLNMCHKLEKKIYTIEDTEGYDSRMDQLENDVYMMTDLIRESMYSYVYSEAVHLDDLQSAMITNMIVVMGVILVVALVLLYFLLTYSRRLSKRTVDPVDKLCERLEAIGKGSLHVREPIQADVEEVQLLSDGIESMVGQLNQLMEKNAEQEKQRRRTELALLQAQMNPHFLYNTMDTIIWLIESGEISEAVMMVNSLSNYFRFSLSRGQNVITLAEEEQHIRSYLEIQQIRYRDLMHYEIDIPDELKKYILPKLTLQPMVENALYHGIKISRRKGFIRITGRELGDNVILEVTDDGSGMTTERLGAVRASLEYDRSEGFGLRTVHQRIQILFGNEYGLTMESTPETGTRVIVTIPKQTIDKEMDT